MRERRRTEFSNAPKLKAGLETLGRHKNALTLLYEVNPVRVRCAWIGQCDRLSCPGHTW
jgi:hypothetical protein